MQGRPEPPGVKIGTAGFTAALAIQRMEQNGQAPGNGPVVVTGATGGVGSLAINMLAGRGYEGVAVSGKPEAEGYLRAIGAARVLRRQDLNLGQRDIIVMTVGRLRKEKDQNGGFYLRRL